MEYLYGSVIAIVVALFASLIGFDRERSFYPVVLIVVASYYLLFAAMGASHEALMSEALPAVMFIAVAVAGFKRSAWFLVVGLASHSVFDLTHAAVIENTGVPIWWPGFCFGYDAMAALYLAFLLKFRFPKRLAHH